MKLQFHGHACFSLYTAQGTHLLFDPFITGNPMAQITADQLNPDVILVSHGHSDHIGDTLTLAQKGPLIITTAELAHYCNLQGLENVHSMQIGGGYQFDFGYVKMIPTTHGSALTTDTAVIGTGCPGGFLLRLEGQTVYYAGDTGLTAEMEMLARFNSIDLAILPIGGNYTMDIPDALHALEILRPKMAVPMHYDTFPVIRQDASQFAQGAKALGVDCHVLAIEETLEF